MKKFHYLFVILLFSLSTVFAQDSRTKVKGIIEPYHVAVTFDKTVNLIFPYSIVSVDRGSSEVLVQKVPQAENVLQLKADNKSFQPTNLTVITGEGSLYSFLLYYDDEPVFLNLKIEDLETPAAQFVKIDGEQSEAVLYEAGKRIAVKQPFLSGPKDAANAMALHVNGIYVHQDVLYFQLELKNNSNINYDVSQFRFYIKDSKRSKRTARQELILEPLHITGNIKRIEGGSKQTVVVAYDKFTIPNKKHLRIELQENNGGRTLELKIRNKDLLRARAL